MGLLTLIQIPCNHVLANEMALNFKYRIGLKHFFNINLGIGIIKKTTFFCLYFRHISPCFYSNFDRERSLDTKLNFASNKYPLSILLMDLLGLGQTRVLYYYLRTNKKTHSVGPFGNNLRTGCSLTRNSYGVPQN